MEKKPGVILAVALGAIALLAFDGPPAGACEPEAKAPGEKAPKGAVASEETAEDVKVTFAGLQMAIDPETGRLRAPTEEEAAALAQGMRDLFASESFAAASGGGVVEHRDGTLSAVLGTDALNFTVLRSNGDGTYARECVASPDQAEAFVAAAPRSLEVE